ncbi:PaaI family thioesterase [Sinimarinibacterium sp. CAU 1509]|uniref:PaaI family thioesterase n=1 Tax=Sinimarinibacterium sp. CAU 1509 TaxID=2562283 RepID=UPI0010AC95D2|nr:PaaI family thioesterase [Sinimarinibacterium sp. CAU 1509]TJY56219.1 PaaI family thioesterase [Sinimarinibacterium sp. CAU 1509]
MNRPITPELQQLFRSAPFVADLGMALDRLADGECDTSLLIAPRHLQQFGSVHAGVLATMADHTAGAAASTLLLPGHRAMTLEFKINLLRPACGERLVCTARALKPGRQFVVLESEVWCEHGEQRPLIAKAMVTVAVLAPPPPSPK